MTERINSFQPVIHELKIDAEYLHEIQVDTKRFEVRKDDRDYQPNDFLMLRTYGRKSKTYDYSWSLVQITGVFGRFEGERELIRPGYVILSVQKITEGDDEYDLTMPSLPR